jgi:hypothetical protein
MQLPIRQEILILPADPHLSFHEHMRITSNGKAYRKRNGSKLGWIVKEVIGVAVVNSRALAKLSK